MFLVHSERTKLTASCLNGLATALIVAGFSADGRIGLSGRAGHGSIRLRDRRYLVVCARERRTSVSISSISGDCANE